VTFRRFASNLHPAQLEHDRILALEMASQCRWNLFLQKICLPGEAGSGCNEPGGDGAVNIERLPAVPQMQPQNSRTLENQGVLERFPGNHRQKNLIENFIDPMLPAFTVHGN